MRLSSDHHIFMQVRAHGGLFLPNAQRRLRWRLHLEAFQASSLPILFLPLILLLPLPFLSCVILSLQVSSVDRNHYHNSTMGKPRVRLSSSQLEWIANVDR